MDEVRFILTDTAGALSLTPGSQSIALSGSGALTVSISQAPAVYLTVSLASSDTNIVTVPSTVVIPAGQTSAPFFATGGSTNGGAIITASAPNATPDRAAVAVGARLVEWIVDAPGNWSNAANWSGGLAPQAGDVVYIDRPAGTFAVTVDVPTPAVSSVYATEPLIVSSPLHIQETGAFDGGMTLGSTLQGTGNVSIRGLSTWDAGIIALGGGLDVEAGQTLMIQTGNQHIVQQSALRNRGTVLWSAGLVYPRLTSTVLNDVGGVWTVQGDVQVASDGFCCQNTFTNAGTLRKTAGAGSLTLGGGGLTVTNTGTIDVQTGAVDAVVTLLTSGHLQVAAGASFGLNNVMLQPGSTFGGAGTLEVSGSTNVGANLTAPLPVTMTGTLAGSGRITMTAPMTWTSGTIALGGGLDIEAGQTLTIQTGNPHIVEGSALRNRGTVLWGAGVVYPRLTSTVLNDVGGVWEVQGDLQMISDGFCCQNTFINAGTLRKTGSLGTFTIGGGALGFTNTGTIETRIGGAIAGQFDAVAVIGSATLGGTLSAQLVNGFVPAVADEFTVLTYGSRTWTFATINGNGHPFATCYGSTTLKLGDPGNPLFCGGT